MLPDYECLRVMPQSRVKPQSNRASQTQMRQQGASLPRVRPVLQSDIGKAPVFYRGSKSVKVHHFDALP